MKLWSALYNCSRIFCHFPVQKLNGIRLHRMSCILIAGTNTSATANTFFAVYPCLASLARFFTTNTVSVKKFNRVLRTRLCTNSASNAQTLVNFRLTGIMLFHFPGTASTTHSYIFDCTANSSSFMQLKMRQGNKHISIHQSMPHFCFLYKLTFRKRHISLVRPLQTISNNYMTPRRKRTKSIRICSFQMFKCIFSLSRVQSITVSQKWNTTQLLYNISNRLCIIRPQVSQISRFSKMNFYRSKFSIKINLPYSRSFYQSLKFFQQIFTTLRPKIRKINLRFFHCKPSPSKNSKNYKLLIHKLQFFKFSVFSGRLHLQTRFPCFAVLRGSSLQDACGDTTIGRSHAPENNFCPPAKIYMLLIQH